MAQVSMEEYQDAANRYVGWCRDCEDFTRECTEPDAEGYDCPNCDQDTVVGAEQAMLLGMIDIDDSLSRKPAF